MINTDYNNDSTNDSTHEKPSGSSNTESKSDSIVTTPASDNLSNSDSKDASDLLAPDSAATTPTTNKRSLAFTFNFDSDATNPAATAAKYKNVMERFQSRHRRGASLSKIDQEASANSETAISASSTSDLIDESKGNNSTSVSPQASGAGSRKFTLSTVPADSRKDEEAASNAASSNVKLRSKNRSTSRVREVAKRHSWSPRSSTNELSTPPTQIPIANTSLSPRITSSDVKTAATRRSNNAASNATNNVVMGKPPPAATQPPVKGEANIVASQTQFTPRSTAMQLALQKVELPCPQPALEGYHHKDEDRVSEAGTYTLNGDNYTEEQKDLMNIDRNARNQSSKNLSAAQSPISPCSPKEFKRIDTGNVTKFIMRGNNVFEVNYYHDDTNDEQKPSYMKATNSNDYILKGYQTADAYLEKIKSRVLGQKSVTASTNKDLHMSVGSSEEKDIGCFTSVTTSGVLAKQCALDHRPKLTRKSSLTTSQIDSSEYISNEMKMKSALNAGCSVANSGGYTDHQKAEYRLNLFTNQVQVQTLPNTCHFMQTPPETPTALGHNPQPDIVALKTAQTKNDWIQQWARNARARSLANDLSSDTDSFKNEHKKSTGTPDLMTRSCTCASPSTHSGCETLAEKTAYSKQQLQKALSSRYRATDYDCASDPSLATTYAKIPPDSPTSSVRPPRSPTKIPSPLHSIGRARSASRTRGSLQGYLLDSDDREGDIYLQKTAAAINNLQESLSRKSSVKSPTSSTCSPRMTTSRGRNMSRQNENEALQNSIESYAYYNTSYPSRHRRNLSNGSEERAPPTTVAQVAQLMTSSFDEQQLQLLTSGEYLIKQMRMRKNSFDGNLAYSPGRRHDKSASAVQDKKSISPLHRVGSFSQKPQHYPQSRSARPNFQNIYTPPAARQQNYVPMLTALEREREQQQQVKVQPIKKSASSNSFRQVYSDYDDNLEYYIQDEDDSMENEDTLCLDDTEYDDTEHETSCVEGYTNCERRSRASHESASTVAPVANTRYNKALLMRIERSKQIVAESSSGDDFSGNCSKPTSAPIKKSALNAVSGVMGCPNTPELPRRAVKSAPRPGLGGSRQSVPRDTSLNRLASRVPNSLASAKFQLLQTAAGVPPNSHKNANQHVQPKYLDISKYKPAQGNAFLRKNESKSTLKANSTASNSDGMKRSPSSSGFGRGQPLRSSNRNIQASMSVSCSGSLGGGGGTASSSVSGLGSASMTSSCRVSSSSARRDTSVSKQKKLEMAMWKRRSTYDPMKAAAEDRRRKEEAKRLAMTKGSGEVPPTEN